MPASVIAERIGWNGGHSVLRARVAELRPIYLPADPCQRAVAWAGITGCASTAATSDPSALPANSLLRVPRSPKSAWGSRPRPEPK